MEQKIFYFKIDAKLNYLQIKTLLIVLHKKIKKLL